MRLQRQILMSCVLAVALPGITATGAFGQRAEAQLARGVTKSEFIFEQAPFPSCHASTIVQTKEGLLAAWFGGTDEGEKDVSIWLSRNDGRGGAWSAPEKVATGETGDRRFPCWNPVLFQPATGPLLLFYKVGPRPDAWWGMLLTSGDGGKTWSKPARLPEGMLGPIKNKPIQLADGTLLCGSSVETPDPDDAWRVHVERTSDLGRTWQKSEPLNDGKKLAAIQPAFLTHPGGRLQLLCRTRQRRVAESWSEDGGKTWQPLKLVESLPNPDSGIDAVTLKDGRALLVYNHTARGRSPLNVAISEDGKAWRAGPVLETEPGEYSYPAIIQATDGAVHITYTWHRKRIRHVVIDPKQLAPGELPPVR
jgi:predicted neuraminidase